MRVTPRRLLVLLLMYVLAWAESSAAQLVNPAGRRELRVGVTTVPATLDPVTAADGPVPLIARQVFDTLVVYREGSTDIEPGLATRWVASRDGLVWTFTLRENVKFHDGSPLLAADVVASFERHLRPETPSPVWAAHLRGLPGVVKEVRLVDPRTVQIALHQPYAPLVTVLAHPGFGVVKVVNVPDGTRLVGTGPYRVVDASPGRLALEVAPGHWAGSPRTERLVFLEVANDDHAEAEFDARSLDVWFPATPPRRPEGVLSVPGTYVGYLAFQTERDPFARQKLRQAVAAALDPAVIGVALEGAAVPLQSFLPAGVWGRREGSPILGGTREAVRKLLVEGGWPKGKSATLLVGAEPGPPDLPRLAQALQLLLGAADVPVILRVEPSEAARAARQSGDHDVALVEAAVTGGDPHLFLFPLSTSEAASKGPRALNYSFYRNSRLDDVLIRASQLAFRPERQRLYQRAQAMLAADLPWIPLYVRLVWGVARPDVRGLRLHPTGWHRLDVVEVR